MEMLQFHCGITVLTDCPIPTIDGVAALASAAVMLGGAPCKVHVWHLICITLVEQLPRGLGPGFSVKSTQTFGTCYPACHPFSPEA